ncbi:MAG: molybdopterin synthase catalytic subunit MoaE [Sphingomonadales bacterium]
MIRVQEADFDVGAEIAALTLGKTHIGGVVTFTGLVRDIADGAAVSEMTLEHYPGMTERMLADIEAEANRRWPLDASLIVHRYGALAPGDRIVLVITASAHRQAAFEAAAFLVDWLKTKAPFWKREAGPEGDRWVEARAADDEAADRWQK